MTAERGPQSPIHYIRGKQRVTQWDVMAAGQLIAAYDSWLTVTFCLVLLMVGPTTALSQCWCTAFTDFVSVSTRLTEKFFFCVMVFFKVHTKYSVICTKMFFQIWQDLDVRVHQRQKTKAFLLTIWWYSTFVKYFVTGFFCLRNVTEYWHNIENKNSVTKEIYENNVIKLLEKGCIIYF